LFRGKWRIRWFDHEGKRQSAVLESHAEAETELRRRQLEATDVRAGLRRPSPADHTFDELADYWEAHRAPLKRSEKDDKSILRKHLRPALGKLRLRDISVQSIDAFKEARASLSPKTVGNALVLLGTMFRQAEELGWLHTAPRIRKPSVDPDDEVDPPWLKAEEIDRLLVAALAEAKPDQPLTEMPHALYSTAAYTGLRAGEAAGLKWSDVDLERRTINVRRSYDGKTKTRASRRHVPIVDVLLPVLLAWKLRCPNTDDDLVFPNQNGQMLQPSARVFQEVLYRCLDRAGFARHLTDSTGATVTVSSEDGRSSVTRRRFESHSEDELTNFRFFESVTWVCRTFGLSGDTALDLGLAVRQRRHFEFMANTLRNASGPVSIVSSGAQVPIGERMGVVGVVSAQTDDMVLFAIYGVHGAVTSCERVGERWRIDAQQISLMCDKHVVPVSEHDAFALRDAIQEMRSKLGRLGLEHIFLDPISAVFPQQADRPNG
jgi:integrase